MKISSVKLIILFAIVAVLFTSQASAVDFIFKDTQYSFQMLRAIAATASGGADVGECLATAYKIKEGDDEGWLAAWNEIAQLREKTGDEFLAKGRKISSRQEYLRASNYYRSAEFFLHKNPSDPRILELSRKSRACFLKFAKLAPHPIIPVEIPYEGVTLPGYLCLVDKSGKKRPLLIIQTGFDGTGEELYANAKFAVERGYNCLIFEGPGQGRVIREQKIPFRYDWEKVVTPVVDFAVKRKEVDKKRIALMGISFGGYLAPRAVAFEHRIKACIANGGIYDFHAQMMQNIEEKDLDNKESAVEIDKYVYQMMEKSPSMRWAIGNALFTFQAKTPSDWFRITRPYTMKDVVSRIKCRMLIVDSSEDKDLPGQSRKLYDALSAPKDYLLFTKDDAAEEHCQIGATFISSARILDWLDDVMKKKK